MDIFIVKKMKMKMKMAVMPWGEAVKFPSVDKNDIYLYFVRDNMSSVSRDEFQNRLEQVHLKKAE